MSNLLEINITSVANAFIGIKSIKNNTSFSSEEFTKKMKKVGWRPNYDWCAFFAKLVWKDAYIKTAPSNLKDILSKINRVSGNSNENWRIAKQMGLKVTKDPKIGSIAVFTNAKDGSLLSSGHTSIVVDYDSEGIYTIDGNTTSQEAVAGSMFVESKYRRYSQYGKPYMDDTSVAKSGKKRYLRGFIIPPKVDSIELEEEFYISEKESLDNPPENEDVTYLFTRDAGILSSKEGIGDEGGLIVKFDEEFSLKDFLNYKGSDLNKTNEDLIKSHRIKIKGDQDIDEDVIKSGTIVSVPLSKLIRNQTKIDVSETESTDYDSPIYLSPSEIFEWLKGAPYAAHSALSLGNTVTFVRNHFRIIAFSKTLGYFIDISQLCTELDINSTKTISNFNLRLVDSNEEGSFETMQRKSSLNAMNLSLILSENDLIFIQLNTDLNPFPHKVSFADIARNHYSLIGLIDSCVESKSATYNEVSLQVSGRDLSKLFDDDEVYFFPRVLTKNSNGKMVIGTGESGTNLLKRTFSTGNYDILFGKTYQSIKDIFQFYISVLQNVGYIPEEYNEEIFSSYVSDDGIDIRNKNKEGDLSKGVYQIIDLYVDETVGRRRVVDASVNSPEGPFRQLFSKICQEPFVEFLTETIYDRFMLIVRQPPFAKKDLVRVVREKLYVPIKQSDITNANLTFSKEIYTWYQLEVQGLFFGQSNEISLEHCPIIQLDEYVNIWGSKRFSVTHNYRNVRSYYDAKTTESFNVFRKQVVDDLIFLLETHAYLPFTRTGTLELGYVNNKIKKGSFIYIEESNELYYVDVVQHSITKSSEGMVTGSTTLTLSRGMIVDYIEGICTNIGLTSYFNIVDLPFLRDVLYKNYFAHKTRNDNDPKGQVVNKEMFNFFLKRKQFRKDA